MLVRAGVAALAVLLVPVCRITAQCPDGSPPPCRSARGAGAGASPSPRSVAVLYFESLSRDTADAYIADGFTEEITGRLGQIDRLSVTSRTAARRLRSATTMSTADLGRALNARFLVNGTVRRSEERLRVTVELVRAATGARVWGGQYDRSADDLLAIESEVARAVATGIAGRLLPAEAAKLATRPTPSPAAYDHYLRGNRLLWRQDEHSVLTAIEEFEAALAVDSEFTAARGGLAYGYGLALNWSYTPRGGLSRDSIYARGLAAAERAVHEDPMAAEGWLGLGRVQSFGARRGDLDAAVVSMQRAVALDPRNDAVHQWLGTALRRVGRFAEAQGEYQLAREINPFQVQATADLGVLAYSQRRFAEAAQWFDSAVALDNFSSSYALRARARAESGDLPGALSDAATALRLALPTERFRLSAELAEMEFRNGRTEEGRQRLEEALHATGWRDGIPDSSVTIRNVYDPALAAVAVGLPDIAIGILEHATPRGPWLWSYLIFPGFDSLRSDPRFIRIFEEAKPTGAPEVPQ